MAPVAVASFSLQVSHLSSSSLFVMFQTLSLDAYCLTPTTTTTYSILGCDQGLHPQHYCSKSAAS